MYYSILYNTILCNTILQTLSPTSRQPTPGLHNKIPAHKIFARVWVAQESVVLHYQR